MDTAVAANALDACRLLAFVPTGSKRRLASLARVLRVQAGHRFFEEGDPSPGLFVVAEGQVRVFKVAPNGKEHTLHLPAPGETFAEAAAIGGFPLPAAAEALVPSVVVLIPEPALTRLLDTDHAFCRQLLVGTTGWVRQMVGLMEDIVLRDAAGRLARYLLDHRVEGGSFTLPSPRRHLASHLNLTPETLSRCLRRLEDLDAVRPDGEGNLRMGDLDRLLGAADGLL